MRRYVGVLLAMLTIACAPLLVEAIAANWWSVAACTVLVFGALTVITERELT